MSTLGRWLMPLLLLGELLLASLIVWKVPYTEIDWIAYMQEVGGFLAGETDYLKLRGDTGPLVYPAGFVYLYSALYYVTDQGSNILSGQVVFIGLYVIFIGAVLLAYSRSHKAPLYLMVLLCLSRRVHSIFVLRLFNDCFAMLFLWIAIVFFQRDRWRFGCFLFSLGVSIKMNVLLFAPGLLLLLIRRFNSFTEVIKCLSICAVTQVVLGIPFLLTHPISYLSKAFELSRVFQHQWTVNFKFLPNDIFQSKQLSIGLLMCTLAAYFVFALTRWWPSTKPSRGGGAKIRSAAVSTRPSGDEILSVMLQSNMIGIVFARSLHYQFYVWYFHSLPYLLWVCTSLPTIARFAMLIAIELVWNVYPSTAITSLTLTVVHLILLVAVFLGPRHASDNASKSKRLS